MLTEVIFRRQFVNCLAGGTLATPVAALAAESIFTKREQESVAAKRLRAQWGRQSAGASRSGRH